MLRDRLNRLREIGDFALSPRRQRPIAIFNVTRAPPDVRRKTAPPSPSQIGTGPKGRVERKQPRLNLGNGKAADRTGEFLGEGDPLGSPSPVRVSDTQIRQPDQARAETIGQPCSSPHAPRSDPPPHRYRGAVSYPARGFFELVKRPSP